MIFSTFLIILGALNILYFVITIATLGFDNIFNMFFLGIGVVLIVLGICIRLAKKGIIHPPRYVVITIMIATVICIVVISITEGFILSKSKTVPSDDADYMIVLGARVIRDRPSRNLRSRLEGALSYARKHPDCKIVVTGGRGKGEQASEASVMREYLVSHGLSSGSIIVEDVSTDTMENLKFAKKLIAKDYSTEDNTVYPDDPRINNLDIVIVTNSYHMYRSLNMAESVGFTNVSGIGTKIHPFTIPNAYLREAFSILYHKVLGNA